eukprot:7591167-Pyramimonas_sp.AAC.1
MCNASGTDTMLISAEDEQIPWAAFRSAHQVRDVELIPKSTEGSAVVLRIAFFEHLTPDGYGYVDFQHLVSALNLTDRSHSNGSAWFHKRSKAWNHLGTRFGLTCSMKASMPYGAQADTPPERCLPFPSMSLKFLLLMSLRSSRAPSERHGLLKGDSKVAFLRVFDAFMGLLPDSIDISVRLDKLARLVGR